MSASPSASFSTRPSPAAETVAEATEGECLLEPTPCCDVAADKEGECANDLICPFARCGSPIKGDREERISSSRTLSLLTRNGVPVVDLFRLCDWERDRDRSLCRSLAPICAYISCVGVRPSSNSNSNSISKLTLLPPLPTALLPIDESATSTGRCCMVRSSVTGFEERS